MVRHNLPFINLFAAPNRLLAIHMDRDGLQYEVLHQLSREEQFIAAHQNSTYNWRNTYINKETNITSMLYFYAMFNSISCRPLESM